MSAAVDFQTTDTAHNNGLDDDVLAIVRVGIAMGEVVVADNTVTGEGIVLAQRLEQLAEPGGVCNPRRCLSDRAQAATVRLRKPG